MRIRFYDGWSGFSLTTYFAFLATSFIFVLSSSTDGDNKGNSLAFKVQRRRRD